ncbi:hypothetical protein D3248_01665 [Leucobacter zeae]|nr:hypothetical protein [Leucobacter zeae]
MEHVVDGEAGSVSSAGFGYLDENDFVGGAESRSGGERVAAVPDHAAHCRWEGGAQLVLVVGGRSVRPAVVLGFEGAEQLEVGVDLVPTRGVEVLVGSATPAAVASAGAVPAVGAAEVGRVGDREFHESLLRSCW